LARAPLRDTDPAQVGRYRLTARLGAGGMGVVYLGTDLDGSLVAVKVLRPELTDDPEFRDRFGREVINLTRVKGVFREVSGQGTVSPSGEVSGTITVAAASIDTKNNKRDTHLRSDDFFDTDNTPRIIFSVDRLTPSGDGVTVTGSLTVRGRTRPISFPAQVSFGGDEVWLDAEVKVNRDDFGLTWNQLGMASMSNTITVHAVFGKR